MIAAQPILRVTGVEKVYGTPANPLTVLHDVNLLVEPGEYVITEPITFGGKAIAVRSESGPEETTIRMSQTPADPERASVVVFENGESAASLLEGFTLTGGVAGGVGGGGVRILESSPTIKHCTITGHRGTSGGGVYCQVDATIVNCPIMGNCCNGPGPGGGGLYFAGGSPTVSQCLTVGNMATRPCR